MNCVRGPAQKPGFAYQPTLRVPLVVWQKLMSYVLVCPTEVNGFGLITRVADTIFVLDDVLITDQEATGGGVDVGVDTMTKFITDLTMQGVDIGKLRLQWHSHVDLDAFFSGIDTNNIERYAKGWVLSIVVNKRGEFDARLDVFEPFRFWGPLKVVIDEPPTQQQLNWAKHEVTQHVKTPGFFSKKPVKVVQPTGERPGVNPTMISTETTNE